MVTKEQIMSVLQTCLLTWEGVTKQDILGKHMIDEKVYQISQDTLNFIIDKFADNIKKEEIKPGLKRGTLF